MTATARPIRSVPATPWWPRVRWWLAGLGLVLAALILCGGYGLGWRWTGLSSNVTLWDWLEALALPMAIASVPLLVTHHRRLRPTHYTVVGAILLVFAVLVLAGYLVPLAWTGFTGNTLWDWLQLLVLPLVVAIASVWSPDLTTDRSLIRAASLGLLVFVALVFCGYLVPLRWTGFTGNTAWDWIKLLLVPALVPTILMPFVSRLLHQRLVAGDPEAMEPPDELDR